MSTRKWSILSASHCTTQALCPHMTIYLAVHLQVSILVCRRPSLAVAFSISSQFWATATRLDIPCFDHEMYPKKPPATPSRPFEPTCVNRGLNFVTRRIWCYLTPRTIPIPFGSWRLLRGQTLLFFKHILSHAKTVAA